MEIRKHRWGLYFAVEDFSRPRAKRAIHDGIDIGLLKDIRPVSIESVKLFVTVHGMVADVTCQASFCNTEADHIDGFFLFPVDPEATLYHFEASLCGKKVVAASREKGENHELSLLEELDGEGILLEETSSDMFTCHIGVVPSDEQVDVMFQYSIELLISPEGDVPFVFPSFIPREFQSRYMGNSFAQSDQQSYSVDQYSFDFYFQAIVAGNYMISDVLSREVLEIDYLDQSRFNAKLTLAGSYLPNRDFAFTLKYADIESPHILVQKGGSESAYDHVVMTNQCGLFTLFHRLNKTRPKTMKGEFIFCVDRSPGMRGHKVQLARETLLYFIKGLPMGCYFNIISFGAIASPLFKSSRVYNQYNVMKAIKCQLKMRADMPGQNVLTLLQCIYEQPIIAGHPKQVFIITEGSDANKHECVEYINQRPEFARVFSIGIGEHCQRSMIAGLARAGNGKPHFLKLNEKPYNTVLECLKQAMQPGLTDLQMEFDTPAGVSCLTIPPMIPPIVFAEEKMQIYILIRGTPDDPSDNECSVTISGTLGRDEPYSRTVHFNLNESMVNENLPVHRLALKTEINDLERSIASALGADDILENEYHIIQASLAANISSRFTPLVGIDALTGQEVEGFPIIRVRADEIAYSGRGASVAASTTSVYKSVSRLTLSRPGESPNTFVRGIFDRQSGHRAAVYSMADSRIHDFDDEVEDGLEMEYTFQRPPATVADLDSELALSEIYMGVSDRDEWDKFKDSLKHPGGLTKFQHPDGYWMLDKKIAYAFCSTITEVKAENPLNDDLVWTTILALNWLKVNFAIRRTEWKEAEDWARAWLHQQHLEGYSLDEMLELAAGLKHLNGHTLFKPPPRPQREISTIDEDSESNQPTNQLSEPVTYMKQESITMIDHDLDDMADEEYTNDEMHDIKTDAIEIHATIRPVIDKPTRSEDATKNHPGHLIVSPSQHPDAPKFPVPVARSANSLRHHHSTAQRQESIRIRPQPEDLLREKTAGRYGGVTAAAQSTAPFLRGPQPLKRSSLLSPSPSNSDGRAIPQYFPPPASESGPIQTQQNPNTSQSYLPNQHQFAQPETMKPFHPQNQPDPRDYKITSHYQNDQSGTTRDPPLLQSEHRLHQNNQSDLANSHNDQSEPSMHPKTQIMDQSQAQIPMRIQNSHQFEGTSHYSPLQPERAFQSPERSMREAEPETDQIEPTHSVPANSTSLSGSRDALSGQSARRPNELALRHTTTSTASKTGASHAELSSEPAPGEEGEEGRPLLTKDSKSESFSKPSSRNAASRISLRSVASTSYAVGPSGDAEHVSLDSKKKPNRSLTFKQRMKNLKDNLLYSYDIKHCHKYNDLTRMNSLRASVRSGRSPYANDYDETDQLIAKRPKRKRQPYSQQKGHSTDGSKNNQPSSRSRPVTPESRSRPVTPESRSRPVTPGNRSRPVTPEARSRPGSIVSRSRPASLERQSRPSSPENRSKLVTVEGGFRPVKPNTRSRPASPEARSRPASPETRSRPLTPELGPTPVSPETKSRPTTPMFRSGTKAPDSNYFRPRTPGPSESNGTPPCSPPGMSPGVGTHSTPLIKPTASRVTASYQNSPGSSFRSQQQTLL